ncbi:alpha-2-macroglobulin-like protein 1 [Carettochelys insculpta]|uniref:alpha-2-macroglobulin-like protein 1 n=1 Tax=Carettochelys insculpta TaxID=44489 RepID=UPI003EBDBBD9
MGTPVTPACLLLLLHLTAGTSAEPHYVVVSPAQLYHPHTGTVSVHLSDLNETVWVRVRLERQDVPSNITLLEREVHEPHLHENVSFQVPAPSRGQQETAELHLSVRGAALHFSQRTAVRLRALEPGTFVQTDKAVYKPGQTVKFRIVSLDKDFVPSTRQLPLVTLQDPSGNRIAQWRDMTPQQGIAELSLPLAAEPALGTYTIEVQGTRSSFSVEEYVLPKFEVTLELPPVVTVLEESLPLRVCGRYTYGKPVLGRVQVSLCRETIRHFWHVSGVVPTKDLCTWITGQTESNGCFSREVETAPFQLTSSGYQMRLQAKASLVEEGTGVELNATKSCNIMSEIATVTFESADATYKAGIPYTAKMHLKAANGSALKNEKLQLFVSYRDVKQDQMFLTDESGGASFELDTSGWTGTVALRGHFKEMDRSYVHSRVSPRYSDAHQHLEPFYSRSQSFLKIRSPGGVLPCDQAQQLQVDYVIAREALGNGSKSLDVVFLVVAKGAIARIFHRGLDPRKRAGLKGSFSVELPVGAELAPAATVLGYTVLPDGELAADSTLLKVAKCLPNKVKLAFSQDRALPGAELQLRVQAAPGSLCAVRTVDRSALLMKPEAELSVDTVYNLLPAFTQGEYPAHVQEHESIHCPYFPMGYGFPVSWRWPNRRHLRGRLPNSDSYHVFKVAALKILTNANTKKPLICPEIPVFSRQKSPIFKTQGPLGMPESVKHSNGHLRITSMREDSLLVNTLPEPVSSAEEEPLPRAYFPETWLWDLVPVGDGGSKDIPVSVPDTITEWKAGMFCTAELGFGLSPVATFTAFKPFFVELALPYSVIRGEAFALKATVFNYLQQCIKVRVTLVESVEFQVRADEDSIYTSCLCADEGKTFQWEVTASSLGEVNFTVSTEALRTQELCGNELAVVPAQGRVDTVIKPLLVQPGGILEEKSHSSLLCQEASEEISLQLPVNVLSGSERAHVTVLGDIMGTALQNIDRLLAMPYGCGEQNMVRFAPNIYIQQYLEKSGQLSPEIRDKAKGFLQSGYQRELLYKHKDGSYSAFGERDATGNTWLTAFVLKSFGQARPYIFIDQQHLDDALGWLQRHQLESGCFLSVGKLLNNALQGGVVDDISLSAYITSALLELGQPLTDPMVSRALQCLRESSNTSDLYTQALLAYAFGLAGSTELRSSLLQSLAQHSVSAGGQLYWQRKVKALPSPDSSWNQAPSAEVEMTAYVLLAYLSLPTVSAADMVTAAQIVRWLSKQQNPYGGFASTQDTVVALQALARYAALTYSTSGAVSVTVRSQAGGQQQFHVDKANRLVLQRAALQEIPGQYTVQASGQGCAFVQLTLRYNVPPPKSAATFDLRVETEPKECNESARSRFSLVLHARYSGERSATNMAILQAKLPSGYIPAKSSLGQLEKQHLVKRLEVQKDQVTIYLEQLTKEEASFTFSLEQDFPVKNLRGAPVRLYDYYETGEHTEAEYSAPCGSVSDAD